MNFQSTCHQAKDMCERNSRCRTAISAVIAHCDRHNCKREMCQKSLQAFYRDKLLERYAIEVAFCLCKKTNNSEEDECMEAQNTLHPSCAQEVDTEPPPACHSVAASCRADPKCGPQLEEFEQFCATDNYTKTCAGYPAQCRLGMLGILGTKLRSNCACKGTDPAKLYECMGWQRVLWFNPCVVEAQREFHMNKVRARLSRKHHNVSDHYSALTTFPTVEQTAARTVTATAATAPSTTTSRTTTTTTTVGTTTITMLPTTTTTAARIKQTTTTASTTTATTKPLTSSFVNTITQAAAPAKNKGGSTATVSTTTESDTKIFRKHSNNNGLSNVINRGREKSSQLASTHSPANVFLTPLVSEGNQRSRTTATTTTKTTTRRPPMTTPLPGCILQKTTLDEEMFIAEGEAIRLYHDYEDDCSEICYCVSGSMLQCQTECIQPQSCRTEVATYEHGSPAYQAYRGRCLCYVKKFICVRPIVGTYTVPPGVFLYLGYSSIDEQLMTKHIHFELSDAVKELQQLLNKKLPRAPCQLSLFSVSEENAVVIAKFRNMTSSYVRQTNLKPSAEEINKDKESCYSALESLAKAITDQYHEIKTNVFLSIFKIGEVDVVHPEIIASSVASHLTSASFLLTFSIHAFDSLF